MPSALLDHDFLAIRDPAIDVPDIMRRIRENMAHHHRLAPLAAALGRRERLEVRKKLLLAIDGVKERIDTYGIVATHCAGWKGKIELAFKGFIRKLIGRHLLQQQQIHERLLEVLFQLVRYLDAQDRMIRARFDQVQEVSERRGLT